MKYIFTAMSVSFFFKVFGDDKGKELYLCGMIVTGVLAIMAQVLMSGSW